MPVAVKVSTDANPSRPGRLAGSLPDRSRFDPRSVPAERQDFSHEQPLWRGVLVGVSHLQCSIGGQPLSSFTCPVPVSSIVQPLRPRADHSPFRPRFPRLPESIAELEPTFAARSKPMRTLARHAAPLPRHANDASDTCFVATLANPVAASTPPRANEAKLGSPSEPSCDRRVLAAPTDRTQRSATLSPPSISAHSEPARGARSGRTKPNGSGSPDTIVPDLLLVSGPPTSGDLPVRCQTNPFGLGPAGQPVATRRIATPTPLLGQVVCPRRCRAFRLEPVASVPARRVATRACPLL